MKFEVGKTYYTTSICDHNCVYSFTVAKRSAKTITTVEGKTYRPAVDSEGREFVFPNGRHSMAPCIRADDVERPLTDWERAAKAPTVDADTLAAVGAEFSAVTGDAVQVLVTGSRIETRGLTEEGAHRLRRVVRLGQYLHTITLGWRLVLDLAQLAEARERCGQSETRALEIARANADAAIDQTGAFEDSVASYAQNVRDTLAEQGLGRFQRQTLATFYARVAELMGAAR